MCIHLCGALHTKVRAVMPEKWRNASRTKRSSAAVSRNYNLLHFSATNLALRLSR
jgi:hypothetical protein